MEKLKAYHHIIQGSQLTLNPRVSVLRHNGGIYLFDPVTCTCASLNDAMLAFITKPNDVASLKKLFCKDHNRLMDVTKHLCELGILIAPEDAEQNVSHSMPNNSNSMMNLTIFVTTKCNLRCIYCYAKGGDSAKTISRDILRLAMNHFFSTLNSSTTHEKDRRENINLSIHGGGEPTVEFAILKDIVEDFCRRARTMGLEPTVCMGTNGTYGDSIHRWIIDNNIDVNVSLDGPRKIQNHLRPFLSGEPSYEVVIRTLQSLVKEGRRVSIRATITDEAMETMEETVELASQLGIAAVHFEPVALTGRCTYSTLSRPDAEQFAETFLKCFHQGLKLDVNVHYSGMRCFEHIQQRYCAACGQNFCITPDGNITTCYEVLESNDPAASLFFIGKVDFIHNRVVLDQMRIDKLNQRIAENMEACKSCFLRYQCAGDCPVKSFRYSNRDFYSPDRYRCQINKRINKQLIAWLADGVIKPRDAKQTRVMDLNHKII